MSLSRRLAALSVGLAVVAGAGAAYVATRSPHASPMPEATAPPAARAAVLAPVGTDGVAVTTVGLARVLRRPMADPTLGGGLAAVVVDGDTGASLLDRAGDRTLPPASTVKLLTAVAALSTLGPGATLSTGVVRSGSRLYLVGGGDVTLAAAPRRPSYPRAATLASLAASTAAALHGAGPVTLTVDTSAWRNERGAPGWNDGYFTAGDVAVPSPLAVDEGRLRPGARPRTADPAEQAGRAFAAALRADGVRVRGPLRHGPAPAGGLGVAAVSSAPVSSLVQRMLTDSDNDLAEALGRAVATRAQGVADFAHEASAVSARLRTLGVPVAGLRLYDASGLSRLDRVSARTLVAVLRLAASPQHPELRPVLLGLPVAGLTGTLADRYRHGAGVAAAGRVRAKTGTLAGVSSLAGVAVDADGRLLVFAFLTDRAAAPSRTEAALDRLAATLARCGCH